MVVALVAWPVRSLQPLGGADWNWVATLGYAYTQGLNFGSQINWSYGPLGFLNTLHSPTLYYTNALVLSWLFVMLLHVLLAGTLLVSLRRWLPLAAAAVVAVVVLVPTRDRVPALAIAWCALMLSRDEDEPPDLLTRAFPLAMGVLTGLVLLGKLNQGPELALMVAIVFMAHPCRRDVLGYAATALVTATLGWLATGQAVADVWPYLRYSLDVVLGYTNAMGTDDPRHWTYAAGLGLIALALVLAWDAGRGMPRRRHWGLVALFVVYAGFTFKEGFVRHDTPHLQVFFGDMLVLFAILPAQRLRQPLLLGGVAACLVSLSVIVGSSNFVRTLDPLANANAVADQARTLVSPARQDAITARVRAGVVDGYLVPQEMLDEIGHRTVMMWPFLYGEIAYGHDLNLRPLPTLEPYAAYTPALDRRDGEMMASRGPARILRVHTEAVDGRFPTFEAPLATLEILCRYRQIAANEAWQLLARSQDRCGAPRTISTRSADWGASVAVPEPRRSEALVLVRVEGAEPGGFELLRTLALRPSRRIITLDGSPFRLVAATAPDGLLLQVPPRADYPGPHTMGPNPLSIAVARDGSQPGGQLRYTFEEIPIRPFPTTRSDNR